MELTTGFKCLDEALGSPLKPGELSVLAAGPGRGKSSLALSIAVSATRAPAEARTARATA